MDWIVRMEKLVKVMWKESSLVENILDYLQIISSSKITKDHEEQQMVWNVSFMNGNETQGLFILGLQSKRWYSIFGRIMYVRRMPTTNFEGHWILQNIDKTCTIRIFGRCKCFFNHAIKKFLMWS